jgi:hypothetical protein
MASKNDLNKELWLKEMAALENHDQDTVDLVYEVRRKRLVEKAARYVLKKYRTGGEDLEEAMRLLEASLKDS